jgi:hypothetical protein
MLLRDRPVVSARKWQVTDLPTPARSLTVQSGARPVARLSRDQRKRLASTEYRMDGRKADTPCERFSGY